MSGGEQNLCGLCKRPVHRSDEPRYSHTRWRHIDANHDARCPWGYPKDPGVQLRGVAS